MPRPKESKNKKPLPTGTEMALKALDSAETIEPSQTYSVSIAFGSNVFSGVGSTLLEALQSVPVPVKIFTKGVLHVSDGVKSMERTLTPPKMKRLFFPLSQRILAKQLTSLMR